MKFFRNWLKALSESAVLTKKTYQEKMKIEKENCVRVSYQDDLAFKKSLDFYLDRLDKIKPPQVIGLYGEWGSGKTHMIDGLIDGLHKKGHKTLKFDAWECRDDLRLAPALIENLSRKFVLFDGGRFFGLLILWIIIFWLAARFYWLYPNAADFIRKVGFSNLNLFSKINLEEIIAATFNVKFEALKNFLITVVPFAAINFAGDFFSDCKKLTRFFDRKKLDAPTPSFEIKRAQQQFKRIINAGLGLFGGQDKKVVIFIDNLDRCSSNRVVPLIEDISNYFKMDKCLFVLAIDRKQVAEDIRLEHAGFDGFKYLEKIVQVSFEMPTAKNDMAGQFFIKRYNRYLKDYFDKDQVSGEPCFREIIIQLLNVSLLANPRRIEKLARSLVLILGARANFSDLDAFAVLIPLILREYFPDIYSDFKSGDDNFKRALLDVMGFSLDPACAPGVLNRRDKKDELNFGSEKVKQEYMKKGDFYLFLQQCQTIRKSKNLINPDTSDKFFDGLKKALNELNWLA